MISILIPVFNYDVNKLVTALGSQLEKLQLAAEIIVFDDGSNSTYRNLNNIISDLPFVQYIASAENNGRVYARKMLAEKASFEWLLFLDCDSTIISNQYLQNYLQCLNKATDLISGGRVYSSGKPADCQLMLHWKYGASREKINCYPDGHPNRFMTNNFLVRKSVFTKFDFTHEWGGYGYEDTLMAIQLEAMNIVVVFANNPVQHDGLENLQEYLSKSRDALQNLKRLSKFVPHKMLSKHVRLYLYYYRLKSLGLLWVVRFLYSSSYRSIEKDIKSCNPSLWKFDLWRLNYFATLP